MSLPIEQIPEAGSPVIAGTECLPPVVHQVCTASAHLIRVISNVSSSGRPPSKRHSVLLTSHPIQAINISGILSANPDNLLQMLRRHLLPPQLRQRQRRPHRVPNLPPIQLIGAKIISDVDEQRPLLRVREVQIFDENRPDLSLLLAR